MRMMPYLRHLPLSLFILLGSCSEAAPTKPVSKEVHRGWRITEIGMTRADHDSAGIVEVVVAGDWILAATNKGVLFAGQEGHGWTRVSLPDSSPASALFAWNGTVYVGSRFNGKLFAYTPATDKWKDLRTESSLPNASKQTKVQRIGAWRENLFVSFRTVGDTFGMGLRSDASLSNWSPMLQGLPPYEIPIAYLDLDSVLLAATYEKGIYQWKVGDATWTKAVTPIYESPAWGWIETKFPRAFAKLDGKVWGGFYNNGIYSRPLNETTWTKFAPDSFARKIPVDIFSMLTWRGRLFAAGRSHSVPLMHDPSTGSWKTTDVNFCYDIYHERSVCDYYTTWSMAASTDTLYAATGGVLLKIGWTDLP